MCLKYPVLPENINFPTSTIFVLFRFSTGLFIGIHLTMASKHQFGTTTVLQLYMVFLLPELCFFLAALRLEVENRWTISPIL